MSSTDHNISLDLQRDMGWFLFGLDEGQQREVLLDLRLLTAQNSPTRFLDLDQFQKAYENQVSGRNCGFFHCQEPNTLTIQRARAFFDTVSGVKKLTETQDVVYEIDQQVCMIDFLGLGCYQRGGYLLVDYEKGPADFARSLFEVDFANRPEFFYSLTPTFQELPQDIVARMKGTWDNLPQMEIAAIVESRGISKDEVLRQFQFLRDHGFAVEQCLDAIRNGFLEFLGAFNTEDTLAVLRRLYDPYEVQRYETKFAKMFQHPLWNDYESAIHESCQLMKNVPADAAYGLMFCETRYFNQSEISDDGKHFGIMQMGRAEFVENDRIYRQLAGLGAVNDSGGTDADGYEDTDAKDPIFDWRRNIPAGVRYFSGLRSDWRAMGKSATAFAVASYNWGPTNMQHYLTAQKLNKAEISEVPADLLKKSKAASASEYANIYSRLDGQTVIYLAKYLYFVREYAKRRSA